MSGNNGNRHPGPLPPLSKGSSLHKTVERAIMRGHANSWAEAYGVGLYLVNPNTREAGKAWLACYGVPASKFFASLTLNDEGGNSGDIGMV
jgi:hypothetical protein